MISEWIKILLPVILTGLGVMVVELFSDVKNIEQRQEAGKVYVYRLGQVELKVKELDLRCKK